MNPLPFVRALISADRWTALAFIGLIAVSTALGVAMTAQERALRSASAKAADRFDLIVSAPGSQTDVLLKTVFLRPGTVDLLEPAMTARLLTDPLVVFAAPLGFGDSYNGNPVAGTTRDLVLAISGGGLAEGRIFGNVNEAVVGAGSPLVIGDQFHAEHGHGDDGESGGQHGADLTVVGRMQPTGSPWDRAIIIPIEQMWLSHNLPGGHDPLSKRRLGPPFDPQFLPGVPAVIVKPKSLPDAYGLRKAYRTEASTAFFPAEVLLELYALMGDVRRLMSLLALGTQALVIAAIATGVIALLRMHRKKFATLRALGAPRRFLFATAWVYVSLIAGAGALAGLPLGWALAQSVSTMLAGSTGLTLSPALGWPELQLAAGVLAAGCLLAVIPALHLYRQPIVESLR